MTTKTVWIGELPDPDAVGKRREVMRSEDRELVVGHLKRWGIGWREADEWIRSETVDVKEAPKAYRTDFSIRVLSTEPLGAPPKPISISELETILEKCTEEWMFSCHQNAESELLSNVQLPDAIKSMGTTANGAYFTAMVREPTQPQTFWYLRLHCVSHNGAVNLNTLPGAICGFLVHDAAVSDVRTPLGGVTTFVLHVLFKGVEEGARQARSEHWLASFKVGHGLAVAHKVACQEVTPEFPYEKGMLANVEWRSDNITSPVD